MDKFEEIKKYKELLENSIISEEEFNEKKEELLGKSKVQTKDANKSENYVQMSMPKVKKEKQPLGILRIVVGIISLLYAGLIVVFFAIDATMGGSSSVLSTEFVLLYVQAGLVLVAGVLTFLFRKTDNANKLLCVSFLYFGAYIVLLLTRIDSGSVGFDIDFILLTFAGVINLIAAIKLMGDNKKKKIVSIIVAFIVLLGSFAVTLLENNVSKIILHLTDGTTCEVNKGSEIIELCNQSPSDGEPYRGATFDMDTSIIGVSDELDDSGAVYVITSREFMFYDKTHKKSYWMDLAEKGQKVHIVGKIGAQNVVGTDNCLIIIDNIEMI